MIKAGVAILTVLVAVALFYNTLDGDRLTVYDVRNQGFIDYEDLKDRLPAHKLFLIGEEHGNFRHHQLQVDIIEHIHAHVGLDRIVMEMLYPEQQIYIDRVYQDDIRQGFDASYIPFLMNWRREIWPWHFYQEVVETAVKYRIPLVHGNISEFEPVYSHNQDSIENADDIETLETLSALIAEAHKGLDLPQRSNQSRAYAHTAVDRKLSQNITRDLAGEGLVLAGHSHIRNDTGVGKLLAGHDRVVSIGMLSAEKMDRDYGEQPFDYVIVTFSSLKEYVITHYLRRFA